MRPSHSRSSHRSSSAAHEFVGNALSRAGISIGGNSPGDIQIHDERFYDRIVTEGALGLGESYMDGWWDVGHLDVFFAKCMRARLDHVVKSKHDLLLFLESKILNMQSRKRAWRVARKHYNIGNAFYADMLGPGMHYTCAYWDGVKILAEAQDAKCELVCRKLMLEPGDSVCEGAM